MIKPAVLEGPGKDRYHRYTLRMANILASAGVLATGALGVLGRSASAYSEPQPGPAIILILYVLPLLSGVTAGIVSLLSCGKENDKVSGKAASPRLWASLDRIWYSLTALVLAGYVLILLFPHFFGSNGGADTPISLAQGVLGGYFFSVAALSVVVLPGSLRVPFLFFVAVLVGTLPYRFGETPTTEGLSTVLFTTAFNLLVMMGVSLILGQATSLDSSNEKRGVSGEKLVDEQVRRIASQRTNEYVHDHVLSTLSAAANLSQNTKELQSSAYHALRVLRGRFAAEQPASGQMLRDAINSSGHNITIEMGRGVAELELDAEVGEALAAATIEAMANAKEHGSCHDEPPPMVWVKLAQSVGRLSVTVTDNGCGFELGPATSGMRFGIERGIRTRMEEVGGTATIHSALGHGTRVTLVGPGLLTAEDDNYRDEVRDLWLAGIGGALHNRGTALAAAFIIAIHGAIIQLNAAAFSSTAPSWVALGACAVAAGFLLSKSALWTEHPTVSDMLVLFTIAGSNFAALNSIQMPGWPGMSAWVPGLGTMLACGLLVRGSWIAAWSWIPLLLLTTAAWTMHTGRPLTTALTIVTGQAVTLAFWTTMVAWSTSAVKDLLTAEKARDDAERQVRIQIRARERIGRSLRGVSERAKPLLDFIAAQGQLTDEVRLQSLMLEASLRDDIRGRSFTGTPVAEAAGRARSRGAEVILLDDSEGQLAAPLEPDFVNQAVRVLDNCTEGRVVIRLTSRDGALRGTIVSTAEHLVFE